MNLRALATRMSDDQLNRAWNRATQEFEETSRNLRVAQRSTSTTSLGQALTASNRASEAVIAFLQEMNSRMSNDPRPELQRLHVTDPDKWQRIWDEHGSGTECPICNFPHEDDVWDSPMNSDIPTRCPHFLCTACWQRIYTRNPTETQCPLCREDVTEWAKSRYDEEVQ